MYRLVSKLIIYRGIGRNSILFRLAEICRKFEEGTEKKEDLRAQVLDEIHRLLDLSTRYGFDHNLWHNYLSFLLATTETPFTLVAEKVGRSNGSVNAFAKNDFDVFLKLFHYDFSALEAGLGKGGTYLQQKRIGEGPAPVFRNRTGRERGRNVHDRDGFLPAVRRREVRPQQGVPRGRERAGSACPDHFDKHRNA